MTRINADQHGLFGLGYEDFFEGVRGSVLGGWVDELRPILTHTFSPSCHGKMAEWLTVLEELPAIVPAFIDLRDRVRIGSAEDCDDNTRFLLEQQLRVLHPWRKGPFDLFGIHIDTEWRSDWKWDRLKDHIQPLIGRRVLDVGCGNGYHCWRMVGAGAKQVIGLDPYLIYVMQFHAIKQLASHGLRFTVYGLPALLPVGIEQLPENTRYFDTVFSMGVLYHRRSPLDHLLKLRDSLRSGGELVLETLVIDPATDSGKLGEVLVPEGRYAKMRNVWFIPSTLTLASWLRKCRFRNIRLVDVTPTTSEEQRTTEWMTFHSLADFLDPNDVSRTVEGHPAPVRAIFVAEAP